MVLNQCTHSAVATTGGVDILPRALVADQLGLVQRVERLSQGVVIGVLLGTHRGDRLTLGQGLPVANRPVLHPLVGVVHRARQVSAPWRFRCQTAISRASRARSVYRLVEVCQPMILREYTSIMKAT